MLAKLYIPRETVYLRPVNGEVRTLDNSNLPRELTSPHVISKYGIQALESGARSALIGTEDMYLIKGCRPTHRCHPDMPYLPLGSQIFSDAEQEVEKTLELSEILVQEGFKMPRMPVGYFIYERQIHWRISYCHAL